jgi:hypothetical protein
VKVEDIKVYIESCCKIGVWEVRGLGKIMEGAELTKLKYTPRGDTLGNPFEHQLRY